MIPLNIQIKSLIYSFFYGIIFSILTNLNYKFIFYSKPIFKFILNILFVLDNVFLYFIFLRIINDGIIHYYFIVSLVLGYLSVNKMSHKLLFKRKHWFLIYQMI